MRDAYSELTDYSVRVESESFDHGKLRERQALVYRFKKPNRIRIDLVTPHGGTTIVYPHRGTKALVRPGGLLRFLTLPLDIENPLLRVSPGQRVDQTSLGLLLDNIERSLAEDRSGEVRWSESPDSVVIDVEARNHFLPDVQTHYTYTIDKNTWLPARVVERSAEMTLQRVVRFLDLAVNPGLPESVFTLED